MASAPSKQQKPLSIMRSENFLSQILPTDSAEEAQFLTTKGTLPHNPPPSLMGASKSAVHASPARKPYRELCGLHLSDPSLDEASGMFGSLGEAVKRLLSRSVTPRWLPLPKNIARGFVSPHCRNSRQRQGPSSLQHAQSRGEDKAISLAQNC